MTCGKSEANSKNNLIFFKLLQQGKRLYSKRRKEGRYMGDKKYDVVVGYILDNQNSFYRIAYCYVHDKDRALDIVQNAICKALENYRGLRRVEAVKTWFYRILVNEAVSYLRREAREISCDPLEMKEDAYEEHGYEKSHGEGEDVFEKVCSLPANMKTVIILRYYEELPLSEIANITGSNLNTVKSRLYGALKKLGKDIREVSA